MIHSSFFGRITWRFTGILLIIAFITNGCSVQEKAPEPYGAVPSERQLAWHKMEMYAFMHFNMNTFTDREWGNGDESPNLFNPTNFDPDQMVSTLAKAGFKGVILTAKHHDGFCLWPSAYTEHSVKYSSWRNGKGDVVRAISDACKKYGIKFGVYLSPWDRNNANYGKAAYLLYYKEQLRELLSNYGNIFEVWFDGANGGSGYYGGSKEVRKIDKDHYYPWDSIFQIVRTLQPNAVMFSDAGPDVRWVGNEGGHANDTCWATYTPMPAKGFKEAHAGTTQSKEGEKGTMNGKYWMPAETDVSIRPGWFYHPAENDQVKSLAQLVKIYFSSVGNGTSLNLNIPPDREGKISPEDSTRLMEFKAYLDKGYSKNFLAGSKAQIITKNGGKTTTEKLTDGSADNYWAETKDSSCSITLALGKAATFNCLMLQEYIPLGQRISSYSVDVLQGGTWKTVSTGVTIGYKKLLRFPDVNASAVRITINKAMAPPVLAEIALYKFPDIE